MASFTPIWQESVDGSGVIANYGEMSFSYGGLTASCGEDKTNLKTAEIIDNGDSYTINFVVAVDKTYYWAFTNFQGSILSSEAHSYVPKELEISVYGDKRTITFEDISASDPNITTTEYVARVDGSELLQEGTTFNQNQLVDDSYQNVATKMSEIIKNNIKNDYTNGIADGKVPVICSDYNNIDDEVVKDWTNGDLIQPNDIVRVDKDNFGTSVSKYKDGSDKFWRVVGRTFSKQGVPRQSLSVQEVKFVETQEPISVTYSVTFPERLVVYSNGEQITSGTRINKGEKIKIDSIENGEYSSVTLNYIRINGTDVSLGQEVEINENITITVSFNAKKILMQPFFFDLSNNVNVEYNPNNYDNTRGEIFVWLTDFGVSFNVEIPTNGYEEITYNDYKFYISADNVSANIKDYGNLYGSTEGAIESIVNVGTVIE